MARTAATRDDDSADVLSPSRWRQACADLGLTGADDERRKLLRAWSGWGRRYHTLQHLTACLRELDRSRDLAQHPDEVELALWFHDAVYRTYRSDNELRSAEWAARFLGGHGASPEAVARVRALVMATAHTADTLEGDAALVVDIDPSILGQPESVYDEFEHNVRREYWWVPKRRYVDARARILRSFTARRRIYHWSSFRERYEQRARANIARALAALKQA